MTDPTTRRDFTTAGALSISALALYASTLSKTYVFEGLARAMPIEVGKSSHLFGGTYLLYGPLGYVFHHLLRLFGATGLAVTSLQLMDACLGAIGLGVFYLLLRQMRIPLWISLVGTACLGFSLGFWR